MVSIYFFDCMCFKALRKYFKVKKTGEAGKIQSREMEKAIKRSRDISEAYLQGGKAVGDIVKSKKKK
ncbi:unnamed protein product [marine sediment metagenome]|uniref:Uncharacterized protein n=1 Tax=marine sediment metagenome TaxID=412755 RepID=X0RNY1_9ZZZZ